MDAFDLEVFGRVVDDYEAIHTIRGDLERELSRPIAADEVAAALLRLVDSGFVDAFEYGSASNSWVEARTEGIDVGELWFVANSRGRAEYERLAA